MPLTAPHFSQLQSSAQAQPTHLLQPAPPPHTRTHSLPGRIDAHSSALTPPTPVTPLQCGALGVCAVPLHTGTATHMLFALTFFLSGGCYQYMQNWIDRETGLGKDVPSWVERLRKFSSYGAIGIMSVFVPGFFGARLITGKWVSYPPIVRARTRGPYTPPNPGLLRYAPQRFASHKRPSTKRSPAL